MQERKQKSRPDPLNFPGEEKVEVGETQYGTFTESRGEGDKTAEKDLTLWQYMTSPSSPLRVHIQEHCQHQWVAVVVSILLFLIILYIVSFSQNPQRPDFCTTNFGTYLGESRGISAYSNCNHDYNSNVMPHYISIGLQKHFTGNKWHSVEYVRRFWMVTRWISLPVVNLPYKFSTITSATNVNSPNRNSSSVKIQHYANLPLSTYLKGVPSVPVGGGVNENNVPMKEWVLNKDLAMIQEGDILIYPKNKKTLPHGHAAVVVGVTGPFRDFSDLDPRVRKTFSKRVTREAPLAPGEEVKKEEPPATEETPEPEATEVYYQVYVAEQNWDNELWRGGNATHGASGPQRYSRILLLRALRPSKLFFLEDTHRNTISEWMRPSYNPN